MSGMNFEDFKVLISIAVWSLNCYEIQSYLNDKKMCLT